MSHKTFFFGTVAYALIAFGFIFAMGSFLSTFK